MGNSEGWAISPELVEVLHKLLPDGKSILELGSGEGTKELCKFWNVTSIEHDEKFLGIAPSNYIHAPVQPFRKQCAVFPFDTGWYDRGILRRELPKVEYDLILVDGPPARIGRGGFYKWLELFRHDVPIVLDDLHRARETTLIRRVSANLRRPYTIYGCWTDKHFGVILP